MFSERAHKSLGELRRRDWIGVPDFHDGAMGRVARARVQRAHRRRGTEGPNLAPSRRESVSRPHPAFEGREPRLSARVWAAGLATRSAETRRAFQFAPTCGNISVGPYSSTAVPLMWSGEDPTPIPTKSGLPRFNVRQIFEFGSGSGKAEHGALIVPSERQT